MRNHRESGIALITALLVLLLVSSLIVGLTWLTVSDQKLNSNYSGRQSDFYVAESGLEEMTAQLATAFNNNYDLSTSDINTIMTEQPTLPGGYKFWDPNNPGNNGYYITYPFDKNNNNNPLASYHTILSGTYAGLVGLLTPYTLQVTSVSPFGAETKLQRTVQTAAIPVFQFGIFSDTDLSFFAGPNFNFGGRVHTNGNLWLAEGGGILTMANKVTAVKEIVRNDLENGYSTSSAYNGTVNITTNPGSNSYSALGLTEGSVTGNSYYGSVSTTPNNNFATIEGRYNGNLENHVAPLNLGIATPSLGGQPIDLIRLPIPGESTNKLNERYYSQASVRILLSDYGPSGGCSDSDITTLPDASPDPPVDIATLSWDSVLGTKPNTGDSSVSLPPYKAAPTTSPNTVGFSTFTAALGSATKTIFPLPVSAATSGTYSSANGYWVKQGYPIETGCLKIDYQTIAGGSFVDATWAVLSQGFTGRNVEPLNQGNASSGYPQYVAPPTLPALPSTAKNIVYSGQGPTIAGSGLISCVDPSPNAIIRFARLRPNPSTAASGNGWCGNTKTSYPSSNGSDYWPNVLFDTREGTLRDAGPNGLSNAQTGNPTPAGAMHYVELDVANLAAWLVKNAASVNNTTGYTVYFSDRRGDQPNPSPAASVVGSPSNKTGAYGFDDIVNSGGLTATTGCPDGAMELAEDFEGDYTNGVDVAEPATPPIYGDILYQNPGGTLPTMLWPIGPKGSQVSTQIGTISSLVSTVLGTNSQCTGTYNGRQYPFAVVTNTQDLQENPNFFFRRALKIVDGGSISIGTCDGVPCGLSIVAENPVYIQGDYNDGNLDTTFATSSPHVACAVIGDAVTLLSDSWNDLNSFVYPYNPNNRPRSDTMYRTAIVSGKGIPFKQPSAALYQDYGTDGGMHNFLRYLEGGGGNLYYHGSVVSFYFSHQATGTYKCCTTVYSAPTRTYNFDTDFETPSLLPPRTPALRAINTIGFTQVVLPTQ